MSAVINIGRIVAVGSRAIGLPANARVAIQARPENLAVVVRASREIAGVDAKQLRAQWLAATRAAGLPDVELSILSPWLYDELEELLEEHGFEKTRPFLSRRRRQRR